MAVLGPSGLKVPVARRKEVQHVALQRSREDEAVEQRFRNMFSTAANRGEGLIEYYMNRHKCGRMEAMKHAIEERERER